MGFKAGCWVGGMLGLGLVAGCGDGGGRVVTNSTWRLWSNSTVSYATHTIMGVDGEMDNVVECSFDGTTLRFSLYDAGLNEFDMVDRPPSALIVDATPDGSICNIEMREQPFGTTAPNPPTYRDSCGVGGGCEVQFTIDGDIVGGTLRCTEVKDNNLSAPLELAGDLDPATSTRDPMTFNFENCRT